MQLSTVQPRVIEVSSAPAAGRVTSVRTGIDDTIGREFEAFVLKTIFEQLLSNRSSAWFGSGFAAANWRSLFADYVTKEIVADGGIGIVSNMSLTGPEKQQG